jgi:hypothetical protein
MEADWGEINGKNSQLGMAGHPLDVVGGVTAALRIRFASSSKRQFLAITAIAPLTTSPFVSDASANAQPALMKDLRSEAF